jgi:hypothetical protein
MVEFTVLSYSERETWIEEDDIGWLLVEGGCAAYRSTVTVITSTPTYNKLSWNDIECRKVIYHRSCIFVRDFLQIRTSPGKSMAAPCFVEGPTFQWRSHTVLFNELVGISPEDWLPSVESSANPRRELALGAPSFSAWTISWYEQFFS